MQYQYKYLFVLTATLGVTLTTHSSFAFTVTPEQPGDSDGTYKYEERYRVVDGSGQGIVQLNAWPILDPRRYFHGQVLEIQPGGTDTLLYQLNERFGHAWEFIPKGNLQGSFNIENYFPCRSDFACQLDGARISNSVGAAFKINYRPEGDDPTGNTVHWIQRTISNFDIEGRKLKDDQIHKDRLDIRRNAESPYFDESYIGSNSNLFRDLPHAQAPYDRTNHYFYAETYLVNEVPGGTVDPVTGIVKSRVEIYSGVRWGWENTFTPPLDLALVFDTTGSMDNDLKKVQKSALNLVNELFTQIPNARVSVVDYRDFPLLAGPEDYPYQALLPFSDEVTDITTAIKRLSIGNGGDWRESAYSALINTIQAQNLGGWREEASKAIILFTDAPPLDPEPFTGYTLDSVVTAAQNPVTINTNLLSLKNSNSTNKPVSIYSVIVGDEETPGIFTELSERTGGKVYQSNDIVGSFSDVIADIQEDLNNPAPPSQSVPEPTPIFSLLLLGFGKIFHKLADRSYSNKSRR